MVTNHSDATATLTFNGTAVWLYGSKGKSNAKYTVTLDDQSSSSASSTFNGDEFSDQDLYQQVLFQATGLDANKTHQLTVHNMGTNGSSSLVIDSVSNAYPFASWQGTGC